MWYLLVPTEFRYLPTLVVGGSIVGKVGVPKVSNALKFMARIPTYIMVPTHIEQLPTGPLIRCYPVLCTDTCM